MLPIPRLQPRQGCRTCPVLCRPAPALRDASLAVVLTAAEATTAQQNNIRWADLTSVSPLAMNAGNLSTNTLFSFLLLLV